ncbi:MAG: hypothetical protein R3B48_27970 [Kofleriaceae bacterium]
MSPPRTLHIRCGTWEQVEAFYSRKLRRGRLLSMRVPFAPELGSELTIGLELPSHIVMTIDGVVRKCEPNEGDDRHWIEIELVGLSEELLRGLRDMVASASATPTKGRVPTGDTANVVSSPPPRRTAAPPPSEDAPPRLPRITAPISPIIEEELPSDERELFGALSTELRRLRLAAVHEVLGVSRDARAEEIRAGWMAHVRRFHPDVLAPHRSDAVSHLAEELTILGNRAYDRLRVALVAEGRGAAFGPALFTPHGWLVGFDDLSTSDVPARAVAKPRTTTTAAPPVAPSAPTTPLSASAPPPAATSSFLETGFEHLPSAASSRTGESYEAQAREALAAGDSSAAREVLAMALVAFPRSRPLRSLYYVASALTALAAGQIVLATSQLETALAHHEGCVEASLVLEQIHRNGGTDYDALRKVFQ